jgi:hypothetical protein
LLFRLPRLLQLWKRTRRKRLVEIPPEDTLEKIINALVIKHHKKTTQTVYVPLEAHQATSSSSDVSMPCAHSYMM